MNEGSDQRIKSFAEFWPFYLREHRLPKTRRIHFVGTSLVFVVLIGSLVSGHYKYCYLLPFVGYGFAWYAHFFVEHNRPATFKYPFYSLAADFKLWYLMLMRKKLN